MRRRGRMLGGDWQGGRGAGGGRARGVGGGGGEGGMRGGHGAVKFGGESGSGADGFEGGSGPRQIEPGKLVQTLEYLIRDSETLIQKAIDMSFGNEEFDYETYTRFFGEIKSFL